VWRQYWQLANDPFPRSGASYVASSGHEEALARLQNTIDSGERRVVLRGAAGSGKTTLLNRLVNEGRRPSRRFARVAHPTNGPGLYAALAQGLGVRPNGGRESAWKSLTDAMRLCRWQKVTPVLIVDDAQSLDNLEDRRDLECLEHLDTHPDARFSVVLSWTEPEGDLCGAPTRAWDLSIRLPALLRSESVRYVEQKLAAAGRAEPAFTPFALVRLHDLSGGVPRGLDRLAMLALMAGAMRKREVVTPDLVDAVAGECEQAA
jgi:MSHA biogenesis protein MshM